MTAEPAAIPVVTRPDELLALVADLRAAGRFAFDTEFVSEDTFEPVLGLVQVALPDRAVLVDPIPLGGDVAPFWDVVCDPAVEVVMHASGEDLRICRIQSGRLPRRVLDVQVAAGLVGYGYPTSLNNLVRTELGITLSGGETRTDWRRRPLSPGQIRYAVDDVVHLLPLADRLTRKLSDLGRLDWAETEFRDRLETIAALEDEDRWRRLPGLHQLNRRGLEVARRLAVWRREDARRSNQPLRRLLRDDLLVAIAKRQPADRRDLEALREFNRPNLLARGKDILAVVHEAMAVPGAMLPEHAERHEEGPGLSMVVGLLAATLSQCCAQAKVAPGLVGSQADIKDLIRWHVEGGSEESRPDLARGWRGEVVGRTLIDVLSGRRSLRVIDPTAEMPVALDPIDD